MKPWQFLSSVGARLARTTPRLGTRLRFMAEWRTGEPELHVLRDIVDPRRLAVDIGANWGMYTTALTRLGCRIVAFEPNPREAAHLRRAFPRIQVEQCGLGSEAGNATLRVPLMANGVAMSGFGTLGEFAVRFERETSVSVPIRRLDDFKLEDVGFIKMDVEGFEYLVLDGAAETLARCRPNLLIELNDRPSRMAERLAPLGYRGWFLNHGVRTPIAGWTPQLTSRHGEPPNNFVFVVD